MQIAAEVVVLLDNYFVNVVIDVYCPWNIVMRKSSSPNSF